MATGGSFISEAFRDGVTYYFEATFTLWRWSANFWDEQGRRCGSIACTPTAHDLEGEALEDAVCDWAHRAVAFGVGFAPQPASMHERIQPFFGTTRHAANADSFGRDEAIQPTRAAHHLAISRKVHSRHRDLQVEAALAMNRFCLAAEDFERLRLSIDYRRSRAFADAAPKATTPRAASFLAAARPPA